MTLSSLPDGARIDYLRFYVRLEWDLAEDMLGKLMQAIWSDDCNLTEGVDFELKALGADTRGDGKRRYIVEAWGPHCVELAALVPLEWFHDLNRIDVQVKMPGVDRADVKAYGLRRFMQDKGKRNIIPMNSAPRHKTNKRDVGGTGLTIGSRKSKQYTILCARGEEVPYVETRAGNQEARTIGEQVLMTVDEFGPLAWFGALCDAAMQFHYRELYRATGALGADRLELQLKDARELELKMMAAMEWAETEKEREYWEGLSTEEQEEHLLSGWTPEDLYRPRHRA